MSNIITTLFGKNEAYFSSLRCGLIKAMYRVGVLIEVAFHLYAMIRECRKAVFILGWIPPFDIFDHTALLIYCLACVTLHGTWAGLVMGAHLNIVPPSATVLANDADRHYHALLCVAHFIGAGFYLSKAVWNHWRGKPWTLQPVIVPLFLGLLHRSLLCIWQLNDDNERRHSFARRSIQRHSVRTSCSEAVAPAASEYRLVRGAPHYHGPIIHDHHDAMVRQSRTRSCHSCCSASRNSVHHASCPKVQLPAGLPDSITAPLPGSST